MSSNFSQESLARILQEEYDSAEMDAAAGMTPLHYTPGYMNALIAVGNRLGISFYLKDGRTVARIKPDHNDSPRFLDPGCGGTGS